MGVFDFLGKAPDVKKVDLDPGTQELLNQGTNRATRPDSEFGSEINQNVGQAAASHNLRSEGAQQESNNFGQTPQFMEALRQSYSARAGENINNLVRSNEHRGRLQKADELRQMSIAALGQQRAATQNYAMLTQAYNQAEMARAQFVSSLFQVGNQAMATNAANRSPRKRSSAHVGGYGDSPAEAGQDGFGTDDGSSGWSED